MRSLQEELEYERLQQGTSAAGMVMEDGGGTGTVDGSGTGTGQQQQTASKKNADDMQQEIQKELAHNRGESPPGNPGSNYSLINFIEY